MIAKPTGPTSHDVVGLVRRLAATRRVGHGGTLDPFASGILPLFLGRATRLAEYHLGQDKTYRATVCFGAGSTTDDLEGELSPSDGPPPTRPVVEEALRNFRGPIVQRPPAFSARKVGGRRAYVLARRGQAPELEPREVTIHRLELVEWDASDPARPIAVLELTCSAGTYVRAIARDLGAAVGGAAYLGALTRTASGAFRLDAAHALETIRAAAADAGPAGIGGLLLPVDAGLDELPVVVVDDVTAIAVAHGQFVRADTPEHAPGPVRIRATDGSLVAIAHWEAGRLAPDKVLLEPGSNAPIVEPTDALAARGVIEADR